jgi:hypothetical protein
MTAAGLALMVTLALAATGIARVLTATGGAGGDFLSFYAAGHLVQTDAGSLYDVASQAAAQRSLYPATLERATGYPLPVFAAWLFAPLSALPFAAAYAVWTAVNVGLLAAIVAILARELRDVPTLPRRAFLAVFATSMPVVANVVFGQIDFIILAAILGAWILLRDGRPGWAGVALAAVLLKPQFLVGVVPMLLVARQWRSLAALCGVGVALIVLPALLTDPATLVGNVRYVAHYPGAGNDLQVNAALMSNWRGLVVSVTGSDSTWMWAPGLAVIALVALVLCVSRWRRDAGAVSPQAYALAVMLPLLVTPHLHTQSLVLLFVPVALALQAHYASPAMHDEAEDQRVASLLLALHVALFACWMSTALGFAPSVLLLCGLFSVFSLKWPRIHTEMGASQLPEAA